MIDMSKTHIGLSKGTSTRTVSISKILFIKSKVQRLLPQKVLAVY